MNIQQGENVLDLEYQPDDMIYIIDCWWMDLRNNEWPHPCNFVVIGNQLHPPKSPKCLAYLKYEFFKSASGLAWEYFFNDHSMPLAASYTQAVTMHLSSELKNSDLFILGIRDHIRQNDISFWYDILFENCYSNEVIPRIRINPNKKLVNILVYQGKAIKKHNKAEVRRFIEAKKWHKVKYKGHCVALYNTLTLIQELGKAICELDGIDFSMSYFIKHNNQVVFSLISPEGGVNVLKIAEHEGGTGFVNNADFVMNHEEGFALLNSLYNQYHPDFDN